MSCIPVLLFSLPRDRLTQPGGGETRVYLFLMWRMEKESGFWHWHWPAGALLPSVPKSERSVVQECTNYLVIKLVCFKFNREQCVLVDPSKRWVRDPFMRTGEKLWKRYRGKIDSSLHGGGVGYPHKCGKGSISRKTAEIWNENAFKKNRISKESIWNS